MEKARQKMKHKQAVYDMRVLTGGSLLGVQVDEAGRGHVGGVRVALRVRRVHARGQRVALAAPVRVLRLREHIAC